MWFSCLGPFGASLRRLYRVWVLSSYESIVQGFSDASLRGSSVSSL